MGKNKLIAIIISGVMIASIVGITNISSNTKDNNQIKNIVLLANRQATKDACVVNGNGNLTITNNEGNIIGYVSVGEMLHVLSNDGNRTFVTVKETGVKGYISNKNMLSIYDASIANLTSMNKAGKIINVSSRVNLRNDSSMSASVVKGLTNNTSINIIGKTGQWYKISVNGQEGFVFSEYVAEMENTSSVVSKVIPKVVKKENVVSKNKEINHKTEINHKINVNKSNNEVLGAINTYIANGKVMQKEVYNHIVNGVSLKNSKWNKIYQFLNVKDIKLKNPKKTLEKYNGLTDLYYQDLAVYYGIVSQVEEDKADNKLNNLQKELQLYNNMRKTSEVYGVTKAYNSNIMQMQKNIELAIVNGRKYNKFVSIDNKKAEEVYAMNVAGYGQCIEHDINSLSNVYASALNSDNKNYEVKKVETKQVVESDSVATANVKKYIAEGKAMQEQDYKNLLNGEKSKDSWALGAENVDIKNPKVALEKYSALSNLYYQDIAVYTNLIKNAENEGSKDVQPTDVYLKGVQKELKIYDSIRNANSVYGVTKEYNEYINNLQSDIKVAIENNMKYNKLTIAEQKGEVGSDSALIATGAGQTAKYKLEQLSNLYIKTLKSVNVK